MQQDKYFSLRNMTSHAENGAARLVPDFFLFFEKALFQIKATGSQLNFESPQLDIQ